MDFRGVQLGVSTADYSRVLTRRTFPAMRFCGCGLERESAQDPPLRTITGTLTGAQKGLQQRWYFSEPLVARRRSIDKPLGLPCGAYVTTRGANAWT